MSRNLWTEDKGQILDGIASIDGGERIQILDSEKVEETITKGGIILVSNCLYCGRQWKILVIWPEVTFMFLGQPVEATVQSRLNGQLGVSYRPPCRCASSKQAPLFLGLVNDIKRWVDHGVQLGYLKPTIYRAAPAVRVGVPGQPQGGGGR